MADSEVDQSYTNIRHVKCAQWLTVVLLCFINLVHYADRFTLAGVLTDVLNGFKLTNDYGGLLQTVFVVSYMIAAPIFGYLGDRYSRPVVIAVGMVMWAVATLLGSFMHNFWWFLVCRCIVGAGESSFIAISPTIISDMFVKKLRSTMMALLYFTMPVGSGIGYILGSQLAHIFNDWRYAMRVTPVLSILGAILILFIREPDRGESEGRHNLKATSYKEDLKYLGKNYSFIFITLGFTCLSFVAGGLSWWAPSFLLLGFQMIKDNPDATQTDVSFKFGAITMLAGILGVPFGSLMSQLITPHVPIADGLIVGGGLLVSTPLLALAIIFVTKGTGLVFTLIFFAEFFLNMNWAVAADMLMYVIVPTRRSSAQAVLILFMHLLGDAGSPYLIGLVSELIKDSIRQPPPAVASMLSSDGLTIASMKLIEGLNSTTSLIATAAMLQAATTELPSTAMVPLMPMALPQREWREDTGEVKFRSMQYSLLMTCVIEALGGIFFSSVAFFVIKDRSEASREPSS